MPGRKFDAGSRYRYGFNGKENDNEVKGEGTQQDYGMRIYDTRLGRFFSVDPITKQYPELTPYQFASNRPIDGIDKDGLEYLSSQESIISISIQLFEFNGQSVLSGTVSLSANKNVTQNTKDYLRYWDGKGRGTVATFRSPNYVEIMHQRQNAMAEALKKEPEMSEAENPNSIGQGEIYTQNIPKNNKQRREQLKNGSFWTSAGIEGRSARANALLAAVDLTTIIVQFNHGVNVENDFSLARKQLEAVQKTVSDIQFGLNNKVFSATDAENMYDFANYLLDGTKPQREITVGTNGTGGTVTKLIDDNTKIERFEFLKSKINSKKKEINEQTANTISNP